MVVPRHVGRRLMILHPTIYPRSLGPNAYIYTKSLQYLDSTRLAIHCKSPNEKNLCATNNPAKWRMAIPGVTLQTSLHSQLSNYHPSNVKPSQPTTMRIISKARFSHLKHQPSHPQTTAMQHGASSFQLSSSSLFCGDSRSRSAFFNLTILPSLLSETAHISQLLERLHLEYPTLAHRSSPH